MAVAISLLFFAESYQVVKAAAPPHPDAPIPDLRSPESALKSFWAIKEWEDTILRKEQAQTAWRGFKNALPLYGAVTTGSAKAYYENLAPYPRETLERTIKSITLESESRAVALVNIKNTTPVSKGAKPTQREITERARGRDFRYILLRQGADWKVSEVWGLQMEGSSLGQRMIYEPQAPFYPWAVLYD